MTNNDIIRRVRYIYDLNDDKMMKAFALGGYPATRAEISDWLKKDDHADFVSIYDQRLANFLNGFITMRRGKKDGVEMVAEKRLDNNQILRKLKIALNFKDTDILEVLDLAGIKFSKHELSAFFRKKGQRQYRQCKDQFLRKFLIGLRIKIKKEEPYPEED